MNVKPLIIILILIISSCNKEESTATISEQRNDSAIKITNSSPKSSQNPCFSPNGDYIVFTRFLDGYNSGHSEIVKIKINGTEEQIIVPSSNSGNVNVPFGSWVNNKICFASDRAGLADEIWVVNDDGSDLTQITTHPETGGIYYIEPVFNPQNTNQIVFEYVTGENDETAIHQIAYLNVLTGNVTLLTDGSFDDRLPSWSNDGTKILFQRNKIGQDVGWQAYIATINTTLQSINNIELISFGTSEYTDCSWNYNDEYILCSSPYGNLETPNIWIFPINNSLTPIQKTFSTTNEDGAPSQSQSGQKIVFESHIGQDEEYPSEIWIIDN